jgi:hypothetical protein
VVRCISSLLYLPLSFLLNGFNSTGLSCWLPQFLLLSYPLFLLCGSNLGCSNRVVISDAVTGVLALTRFDGLQ